MTKKRIVLVGCALACTGTVAFVAARYTGERVPGVRAVERAERDERDSNDDEEASLVRASPDVERAPTAQSAGPKTEQPHEDDARPSSANAARYAAPAPPAAIRAAAEAVQYVPLASIAALGETERAATTNSTSEMSPPAPESEPAVLNGDRATQIRQYVALQQSIERAELRLRALPEGDPAAAKLAAFAAQTQAQLDEAERLLASQRPTPSELATARHELARLSAQAKPPKGPGG